jgi:ABC-type uncharacterized transport system substrate-binding protein
MKLIKLLIIVLILIFSINTSVKAQGEEFEVKQWRIGYYESGDVPFFNNILKNFVEQLIVDGYFPKIDMRVFDVCDSRNTWHALSQVDNAVVKFVEGAYWSNQWVDDVYKLPTVKVNRAIEQHNLDVVLIMGTLAAQRAVRKSNTIFIVMGASNVYSTGITKGGIYSGYANVFATINPFKYKQQIKTFYTIIDFKKLGIVYRNDPRGRSYSAVSDVEEMAVKLGFDLVSCFSDPEELNETKSLKDLWECYDFLSRRVDAMYITIHGALLNHHNATTLAAPFLKNKVPTFVQEDPELVRHGFLMAIAPKTTCKSEGVFVAKNFEKIMSGAIPGELDMRFHEDTKLYINLETAMLIDLDIPESIKLIADTIYKRIEPCRK